MIDLSAHQAKTATRRLVTIEPALTGWLEEFKLRSGPIIEPNFNKRLNTFKTRLANPNKKEGGTHKKVAWKQNVLRHSFGSYHLALYGDASKTALEMGHSSTDLLFKHYREVVTQEAAQEWFGVTVDLVKQDDDKVVEMAG